MPRRLGQHFLHERRIVDKIVEAAELTDQDRVLEIGPGRGAITGTMLEKAGHVTSVELDEDLAEQLPAHPKFRLVKSDILKVDLPQLLSRPTTLTGNDVASGKTDSPQWKVVANLPYYITTPIIEKLLLEGNGLISRMIIMIQREVAERMGAQACRLAGSLSYFVQYHARVRYLFTVKPGCFSPPPKVDSAVVALDIYPTPPVEAPAPLLFQVVRTAFNERRKTLKRSLRSLPLLNSIKPELREELLNQAFTYSRLDGSRRPETLTLAEFSDLAMGLMPHEPNLLGHHHDLT